MGFTSLPSQQSDLVDRTRGLALASPVSDRTDSLPITPDAVSDARPSAAEDDLGLARVPSELYDVGGDSSNCRSVVIRQQPPALDVLPNEVLLHILGFLDVSDLLSTSRVSQHCDYLFHELHVLILADKPSSPKPLSLPCPSSTSPTSKPHCRVPIAHCTPVSSGSHLSLHFSHENLCGITPTGSISRIDPSFSASRKQTVSRGPRAEMCPST